MYQILQGISYLDSQKIVHRDLKPENILLKDPLDSLTTDSVKIIDFGLSSKIGSSDLLHFKCGTPGYIAPEILNADKNKIWTLLNNKIDIFSAGVILHQFLFRKKIFEGDSTNEILEKNKIGRVKLKKLEDMLTEIKCPEAYDLMKKMIEPRQELRINIQEALNHPFFDIYNMNEEEEDFFVPSDEEDHNCFLIYGGKKEFANSCLKKLKFGRGMF